MKKREKKEQRFLAAGVEVAPPMLPGIGMPQADGDQRERASVSTWTDEDGKPVRTLRITRAKRRQRQADAEQQLRFDGIDLDAEADRVFGPGDCGHGEGDPLAGYLPSDRHEADRATGGWALELDGDNAAMVYRAGLVDVRVDLSDCTDAPAFVERIGLLVADHRVGVLDADALAEGVDTMAALLAGPILARNLTLTRATVVGLVKSKVPTDAARKHGDGVRNALRAWAARNASQGEKRQRKVRRGPFKRKAGKQ